MYLQRTLFIYKRNGLNGRSFCVLQSNFYDIDINLLAGCGVCEPQGDGDDTAGICAVFIGYTTGKCTNIFDHIAVGQAFTQQGADHRRSTIKQAVYYFNYERSFRELERKTPVLLRTEPLPVK